MGRVYLPKGITKLPKIDPVAKYPSTPITIEGVVSEEGQGGWPGKSDKYEVHCFTLAAWRTLDGTIDRKPLTVLRAVRSDQEDCFSEFPAYSVLRFTAFLSAKDRRAVFEKKVVIDIVPRDLKALTAELRKPVTVQSDLFGKLKLDKRIEWFEGKGIWNKKRVQVTFEPGPKKSISKALATAGRLWEQQQIWKERVDSYAVKKLLDLKNSNWRDDDEPEVTSKQFLRRMRLESIHVSEDGGIDFWHNDGDLFYGHSILVRATLKRGPFDVDIPG